MITITKSKSNGIRETINLTLISKLEPRSVFILIAHIDISEKEPKIIPIIVQYNPEHENDAIVQFRQYLYWEYGNITIPEILTYKLTGGLTPHSPKSFDEYYENKGLGIITQQEI